MMKKGFLVSVALVLMAFLSASVLIAQEKASGDKEMATCQKEMKLSDEQKAKVKELAIAHRMKAIDLEAEREKLGLTLKKEWMKPEPSAPALENIIKQMSAVREKIQLNTLQHVLAMRKLLGPDWRMCMKAGGKCCEMMGEPGMPMFGEDECCPMMRGGHMGRCMGGGGEMKGGCMMHREGMGAGCGMGAMKGGCMMQKGEACKGGMKESRKGTSSKKGEAPKEGKCPFEMKKETEKKH